MAITLGRILISFSALGISLGAFVFDYDETHVLNPRWPPHARFHNGQTMSLGVMLAAAGLYCLWRPKPPTSGSRTGGRDLERDDLITSAIIGSMYTAAGLTAIWYPGTAWTDPEFIARGDAERPQLFLFSGFLAAVWVGVGLEMVRLRGLDVEQKKGR